jgi:hypothetical protein
LLLSFAIIRARERVTPINCSNAINACTGRLISTAPALAWPWCNLSSAEKEEQDLSNGDNLGLNAIPCFTTDRGAKFALGYESCDPGSLSHLTVSLKILNCRRLPVAVCESADTGPLTRSFFSTGEFFCEFDRIPLMPGQYSLDVSCRLGHTIVAQIIWAGNFTVIEGVPCPDRPLPRYERGDVLLDYRWRFGFPSTERG